MSRKSSVSQARFVADVDLQSTELNSRDRQRERLQTQKGFRYTLDIKVAAFEKETKALLRAIQEAQDDNLMYAEATLISLQVITKWYRSSFQDLEALFSTDRWGESDEIALKVRDLARTTIDSAEKQIELSSKNLPNPIEPGVPTSQNEHPLHTHAASNLSRKSSSNKSSRSSKSALSSTKLKAMVNALAEKEQADYDFVIAKKENEIKLQEAEEKKRSLAMKAHREHEMAVLKARQRAAVAEAKINVIQQSLSEEKLSERNDYELNYSDKKRTREWIRDQKDHSKQTMRDDLDPDMNLDSRTVGRESKPSNLAEVTKYPSHLNPQSELKSRPLIKQLYHDPTNIQECMLAIAETNRQLTASLARQNLPKCHPDVFSGDFAMFHAWKNAFKAMIRDADISPEQEMNYLMKYTSGEPQKLVENFRKRIYSRQSYLIKELWIEMEKRFGNVASITNVLLQRLEDAARFGEKEVKKLQQFSDLCENVNDQMTQLPGLKCLNYPNVIRPLVSKLPWSIQKKWDERVVEFARTNYDLYSDFQVFTEEVRKQAQLKNHPNVTAYENLRKDPPRQPKIRPKNEDHRILISNTDNRSIGNEKEHCQFHDRQGHNILECKAFSRKTLQERSDWTRKAGLCFRCFSKEHIAKNCKESVKCQKCDSTTHLTLFHFDQQNNSKKEDSKQELNSSCTNLCSGTKGLSCSKIVLLDVFFKQQPHKVRRVYAIIDDQSNASMITPTLADELGCSSPKEKYLLSTCGASRVTKFGRRIQEVASEIPPLDPKAQIHLLIGRDAPEILKVRAFKNGPKGAPWAHKLLVGWTVSGQVCIDRLGGPVHLQTCRTACLYGVEETSTLSASIQTHLVTPCSNYFRAKEPPAYKESQDDVFRIHSNDNDKAMSIEDRRFLDIMEKSIQKNALGNWETPLPFRSENPVFPNNRIQALQRFRKLRQSFKRNPKLEKDYVEFIGGMLKLGHATPVNLERSPQSEEENGKIWYLPYFGVYHSKKPGRIRVVFDSSAEFNGVSLNKELLPGPDLANNLIGVLIRFRQHNVAVTCDIQHMFYCFYVYPDHRSVLRFLWFEDNDPTKDVIEYEMTVHSFGNSCSPAVANLCLRKTAEDGEETFGSAAKEFVHKNFYIDDGLTSTPTDSDAISLVKNRQDMLATANIRLHKVVSNSVVVMESFPAEDRIDNLKNLDLQVDPIPLQRSLGVYWDVKKDAFTFLISLPEKPYTRRSVLAIVNSTYDPLGLIVPVTLGGRLLLRKLTDLGNNRTSTKQPLGWDDVLPSGLLKKWQCWRDSLYELRNIFVPRCYHPKDFGQTTRVELHTFADASEDAIGATIYLRQIDDAERVSVSLIFTQTKLAPKRLTTIPRLELCAAVLSTEATKRILKELTIEVDEVVFYSDSKVVLGYIQNESKRFFTYVANRVQIIRQMSTPTKWRYVDTTSNPADLATRSVSPSQLMNSKWFQGPEFLHKPYQPSLNPRDVIPLNEDDPEIRPLVALKTTSQFDIPSLGSSRFTRFSKWSTLRRVIARLILKIKFFRKRREPVREPSKGPLHPAHMQPTISSDELNSAEEVLVKSVQMESFASEIEVLTPTKRNTNYTSTRQKNKLKTSHLYRLDPFLDERGILRVGGRIRRSHHEFHEKHPALLRKDHHLSYLVIDHYHKKTHHQGRLISQGAVLQGGFWIISCRRMVSKVINRCVTCRRLRARVQEQYMSDLPVDRLETPPPFTNVGFDVFGPWMIHTRKHRGGSLNSKRWGLIFTCLNSRAIHLEVLESMDTSSFLCGLRRFFAIRGPANILRCDQGTNFLGGKVELENALQEMDQESVQKYLSEEGCQWILNPPHASHFGGAWERQIGTVRRVLDVMLAKLGPRQLSHELLVTLMAEVSAIVNARPIGILPTDPDHPQPLSPATLLTMKTRPLPAPPGTFTAQDIYSRKYWRRVQYLAQQFWIRWKQEYLQRLQLRTKWTEPQRNLRPGDIIILKEDTPRNYWKLGRIVNAIQSEDGKVRKAEVAISKNGVVKRYLRPIKDFVVLIRAEEQ